MVENKLSNTAELPISANKPSADKGTSKADADKIAESNTADAMEQLKKMLEDKKVEIETKGIDKSLNGEAPNVVTEDASDDTKAAQDHIALVVETLGHTLRGELSDGDVDAAAGVSPEVTVETSTTENPGAPAVSQEFVTAPKDSQPNAPKVSVEAAPAAAQPNAPPVQVEYKKAATEPNGPDVQVEYK
jgi:hypothetical protein